MFLLSPEISLVGEYLSSKRFPWAEAAGVGKAAKLVGN